MAEGTYTTNDLGLNKWMQKAQMSTLPTLELFDSGLGTFSDASSVQISASALLKEPVSGGVSTTVILSGEIGQLL